MFDLKVLQIRPCNIFKLIERSAGDLKPGAAHTWELNELSHDSDLIWTAARNEFEFWSLTSLIIFCLICLIQSWFIPTSRISFVIRLFSRSFELNHEELNNSKIHISKQIFGCLLLKLENLHDNRLKTRLLLSINLLPAIYCGVSEVCSSVSSKFYSWHRAWNHCCL